MVVNTETLAANPDFGKALVGAWYETMALMALRHARGRRGADRDGRGLGHRPRRLQGAARRHRDVLRPRRGRGLRRGPGAARTTMVGVAEFLFDKGILGTGAPSADFVGVAYPDGSITGDPDNVKFRFDIDLHEDGRRRRALSRARGAGMRLINRRPGPRARGPARAAALRAGAARLQPRLGGAARREPGGQAAAGAGADPRHRDRARHRARPALGRDPVLGRHRRLARPPRARPRHRRRARARSSAS